jgi:SAM-dependent methyltransferase
MQTREDIMLDGLVVAELAGVEIGPLDRPLVRKDQGYIHYVDHCDTEALKERWSADPDVDTDLLHVDAVWGAHTLREALSAAGGGVWPAVDYVLASHVVEHVPDLVSWLNEVTDVLKPGGTLRLAVPDKRYTFDYLRKVTTLAEVSDAFAQRRRAPSGAMVLDFNLKVVRVDCGAAWNGPLDESRLEHYCTPEEALAEASDAETTGTYHDVHCWVFTPESFALLMADLAQRGLMRLSCANLVPTRPNTFEFFVDLRPADCREQAEKTWREAAGRCASAM